MDLRLAIADCHRFFSTMSTVASMQLQSALYGSTRVAMPVAEAVENWATNCRESGTSSVPSIAKENNTASEGGSMPDECLKEKKFE